MVKLFPCVASCALALMAAFPAAPAAHAAEPAHAASLPPARVRPQPRRPTARQRAAARSATARLRRAQAALKRARAEIAASAERQRVLDASLSQARRRLLALSLVALFLMVAMLWSLWRGRSARLTIVELTQELAQANHALKHMDQINDQLSRARQENAEHVRRRQNQDMAIDGLSANVARLKGAAKHRAVVSARMQLETLQTAAAAGGDVVTRTPLVNGEEQLVLEVARAWTQAHNLQVFVQVGMGGFLNEEDGHHGQVLATFNSKRSDFVVCDKDGNPLFVIEHHGGSERYRTGHFQGDWADRDRVKRRLLNLANLGLVVTRSGWTEAQIRPRLEQALNDPAAAVPSWPEAARKDWSPRPVPGSRKAASDRGG